MQNTAPSKVAFRFAAPYFLLYSLYMAPYPIGLISEWLTPIWEGLMRLVGRVMLGLDPIIVQHNGSGDTTADYVHAFTFLLLASLVCIVWTILEHGREYPRFAAWTTTWARYWLATWMASYGVGKLFPIRQFPEPDLIVLTQTYGDSSPMRLAWTFMGYSQGYTAFTGAAELLGGILLLFRRTTTLGALVCIGVMANVVALNFFYDIPVKLFSSHLLAVAVVIAALDGRRLAGVFLLGKATAPQVTTSVLAERPRLRKGLKAGYIAAVILMLGLHKQVESNYFKTPVIHGVYEVVEDQITCDDQFECGPSDMAPMRQVVFGRYAQVAFDFTNGERSVFGVEIAEERGHMSLKSYDDEAIPVWSFERSGETLRLDGRLGPARHRVTLRPSTTSFPLDERGFRWINEAPHNR